MFNRKKKKEYINRYEKYEDHSVQYALVYAFLFVIGSCINNISTMGSASGFYAMVIPFIATLAVLPEFINYFLELHNQSKHKKVISIIQIVISIIQLGIIFYFDVNGTLTAIFFGITLVALITSIICICLNLKNNN